jgi:hypothetical protein
MDTRTMDSQWNERCGNHAQGIDAP